MKFAKTIAFHLSAIFVSIILAAAVLLGGLKLIDNHLLSHRHPNAPDDDADQPTMRTLDFYPFTGGHIQAYKREGGRLDWSDHYDDFDVVSGEYGFFIDFRLESPPPKQNNEIRFVLTGGSAAQGWGGRTNADMFYQLLPKQLTEELRAQGRDCKVTVVNLAMGSSHIYQNFVALNKWAHPLKPDAIISFSGHNEIAVPQTTMSDADVTAAQAGGLIHVLRYSASPHWLKLIARYYPGIVKRTAAGSLIRLMYLNDYSETWQANYILSRIDPGYGSMSRQEIERRYKAVKSAVTRGEIVDTLSIPLYVHSLESISRDFPNTPLFAVFQPIQHIQEEYTRMTVKIPRKVNDQDHYDNVKFLNLQDVWRQHDFYPGSMVDPVHLSNEGHRLVTTYLSDYLRPFAQDRCDKLTAANAAPAR